MDMLYVVEIMTMYIIYNCDALYIIMYILACSLSVW